LDGPDGLGNCLYWPVDQWITVYYKIHIGSGGPNSTSGGGSSVESWYAPDGGSYVKWLNIHDTQDGVMFECEPGRAASAPCLGQGFNNIGLMIHPNVMDAAAPYDVSLWFDELVVSSQPIAVPGTGGGVNPPSGVQLTRRRMQ
jgi:hypothetical protein